MASGNGGSFDTLRTGLGEFDLRPRDFAANRDYVHFNPVKHGYVRRVAEWPRRPAHVLGVGARVCTAPFPSMPVCFWNDMDGAKYRKAYFDTFSGVWAHGDYAKLTEHEGLIIHGRSDAVLNPGGVRIGTAEIYRQVESLSEVLEAIAVWQEWPGDVRVVLFVRLGRA